MSRLGAHPLVVQIPIGVESAFEGVIDVLTLETLHWTDDLGTQLVRAPLGESHPLHDDALLAREALVEALAEVDDEVMGVFLGRALGGRFGSAPSWAAARDDRQRRRPGILRVSLKESGRSAASRRGGRLLAVAAGCPADPSRAQVGRTTHRAAPVPDEPFLALAFKVLHDPHRGPLVFFRVYSGQVRLKDALQNVTKDRKERPIKLLQVHANKTQEIEEVGVGNIAAAVGLRFAATGDTLVLAKDAEVLLAGMQIPEPVIFRAIEAKARLTSRPDRGARASSARRSQLQDPCGS